jgi:hypothetical protein
MPRYHMNYFRPELKMRPWLLRGCGPNSSGHGPCPWPMSMAHGFLKLIWYVTDMSGKSPNGSYFGLTQYFA